MATEQHKPGDGQRRSRGLIVPSDDLEVGEHYAILGFRRRRASLPIAGWSFKVTAMCRPFIVVEMATPGGLAATTLDTRLFDFIRADKAFVAAQLGYASRASGGASEAFFVPLREELP